MRVRRDVGVAGGAVDLSAKNLVVPNSNLGVGRDAARAVHIVRGSMVWLREQCIEGQPKSRRH